MLCLCWHPNRRLCYSAKFGGVSKVSVNAQTDVVTSIKYLQNVSMFRCKICPTRPTVMIVIIRSKTVVRFQNKHHSQTLRAALFTLFSLFSACDMCRSCIETLPVETSSWPKTFSLRSPTSAGPGSFIQIQLTIEDTPL